MAVSGRGERVEAASRALAPRVPGEPGVWVLILGELVVFAALFVAYVIAFAEDAAAFRAAQASLELPIGVANTLILLTSSLLVVGATTTIRNGQRRAARGLVLGAIACGVAFAGLKGVEYGIKLSDGVTPSRADGFFDYFYALTGLHFVHVTIGVAALCRLYVLAGRERLDARQRGYAEGIACYWHMVDLLWVLIFALVYLVR